MKADIKKHLKKDPTEAHNKLDVILLHADSPSYREQQFIELDIKLDELANMSQQGRRRLKNIKHEVFCHECVYDYNATQAYIRTGYSSKGASTSASKLLQNPLVRDRIRYLHRKRLQKTNMTPETILNQLMEVAGADILDYCEIDQRGNLKFFPSATMPNTGAIKSIKQTTGKTNSREIVMHDKLKALDMLMRHADMYNPLTLLIKQKKMELELAKAGGGSSVIEDDGFTEAMSGMVDDIVNEYEQENNN